jgi:predicted house-cleaning NTP pyrophosphatase (Maf/HAM1 superfamily)
MARFGIAFAILLSTSEQVQSFHNFHPQSLVRERARQKATNVEVQRGVTASSPNPDDFVASVNGEALGEALNSVTNEARDYIVKAVISDEPDVDEAEIALKQRLVKQRDKTYKVTLPLAKSRIGKAQVLSMGLTLRRINKGRSLDSLELNLDTLEFVQSSDAAAEKKEGVQRMDEASSTKRVAGEFQGLVVASVTEGSAAWAAGVRAGDIVKATSATIGSQLWPKSTLEGVRSAIMSRKAVFESIQFEFQRLGEAVDNQFELTLTRPIGLQLKGKQKKNKISSSSSLSSSWILESQKTFISHLHYFFFFQKLRMDTSK